VEREAGIAREWSIAEVARMSGVTTRTLRHYDAVGLLPPAAVKDNSYRVYGEAELLRLQQVLVLRELGLSLAEIGQLLEEQQDAVPALRSHYLRLLREVDRVAQVARTVARTLAELEAQEGELVINRQENLFEGFDPSRYDEEAKTRWPKEWEASQAFVATQDPGQLQRGTTAAMIRMAELMADGKAADDPAVQEETRAWHAWISRMWVPDAEAFTALGQMYVDDERFRATYEAVAPGLAEYYRDAMARYAEQRLN
jgi:DNA-binding transcriptional MerR regulator